MILTFARSSFNNVFNTNAGTGMNAGLFIVEANVLVNSLFVTI